MEEYLVGDVVVVSFPFSNLTKSKLRPALVLAQSEFDNLILCQITSKQYSSKTAIKIDAYDFTNGALPQQSFVRPDKLFTADKLLIRKKVGTLSDRKLKSIGLRVRNMF